MLNISCQTKLYIFVNVHKDSIISSDFYPIDQRLDKHVAINLFVLTEVVL